MARCPFIDDWLPCTQPNTFGAPGSNGKVTRIVIHTVGVKTEWQHVAAGSRDWWAKQAKESPGLKVSAHFTVERDGCIAQHVDTAAAAYGTGWLTTGSIHIEHAGHGEFQELTYYQLHWSAYLLAWLNKTHPDIPLTLTGQSLQNWGNPESPGITTHRYIQLEYLKRFPGKPITPKTCPGKEVNAQLDMLAQLARTYRPNVTE